MTWIMTWFWGPLGHPQPKSGIYEADPGFSQGQGLSYYPVRDLPASALPMTVALSAQTCSSFLPFSSLCLPTLLVLGPSSSLLSICQGLSWGGGVDPEGTPAGILDLLLNGLPTTLTKLHWIWDLESGS